MEKFTVLIESRPFCAFDNTPMEDLNNSGMELIDMRGSGVEDPEFVDALGQVDAILCGNDLVVNDEVLDMAPRVKAIAKMGAGLDTVDIAAATRHNPWISLLLPVIMPSFFTRREPTTRRLPITPLV